MLSVLLVVLLLALTGCDKDVSIAPPRAGRDSTGRHAEEAQQALDHLVGAVRSRSRSEAVATAASPSRQLLGRVYDNAAALRVTGLSLRYVDEAGEPDQRERALLGPDAWRATVQLSYRYDGFDTSPVRLETSVTFVPEAGGVHIGGFGGGDVRTPVWLIDPLSVVRTGRTLLAVAGPTPGRYPGLVSTAVRQVSRVLPRWHGPLLVEVPGSQQELEAALRSEPGEYDNIAAVTTSVDGSLAPGAPVRVFVNPAVFGRLRQRGAQVVMSHEATHVATGATFASMPTWLLEGFADYVALDHAGVPVDLAAAQILARIRKHGLPSGLPSASDLDPTANGLGATYEEAWLACRFLAQQYGEPALVRFYRAVDGGSSTTRAFRSVLGTSQADFVRAWRADLSTLAGVGG